MGSCTNEMLLALATAAAATAADVGAAALAAFAGATTCVYAVMCFVDGDRVVVTRQYS